MVTEIKPTEQVSTAEEQDLGQLLKTAGAEEPVATEVKEPVAEESTPGSPKTFTEDEVRERILSEANSIAAKSLQSFQKANEALTRRLADMEVAAAKRQRAENNAQRAGIEIETWGDTPEVREFQKTREANEEFYDKVSVAYEIENAKWAKTNSENINIRLFLKYNLPDGEEILKQLGDFARLLGEGSEAERELKALQNSLEGQESIRKVPKLDSGRLSAPGGKDFGTATPTEKVAEQMRRDRNKSK